MIAHTYAIEREYVNRDGGRMWTLVGQVRATDMAGARMALMAWKVGADKARAWADEGRLRLLKLDPAAVQVIPYRATTEPGRRVVRLGVAA